MEAEKRRGPVTEPSVDPRFRAVGDEKESAKETGKGEPGKWRETRTVWCLETEGKKHSKRGDVTRVSKEKE